MPPSKLTTKPWMRPAKEKWDCCVYTRLPGVTWFVWVTRKLIDLWHSYSNSRGGRKVSTRIWRQVIIVSNGSLASYFSQFFFSFFPNSNASFHRQSVADRTVGSKNWWRCIERSFSWSPVRRRKRNSVFSSYEELRNWLIRIRVELTRFCITNYSSTSYCTFGTPCRRARSRHSDGFY